MGGLLLDVRSGVYPMLKEVCQVLAVRPAAEVLAIALRMLKNYRGGPTKEEPR
jgi:hypothetical protein